jgi:hypothetical protein
MIRIRAILDDRDNSYKTCSSIRIFLGIMPMDAVKDHDAFKIKDIPVLKDVLVDVKDANRAKLDQRRPVKAKENNNYVQDFEVLQNTTIEYDGKSGDLGFYYEINENIQPDVNTEISEITASLYPDYALSYNKENNFEVTDIPLISTSTGKTYINIPKIGKGKKYTLELRRQKLLSVSDSTMNKVQIPSNIVVNSFFYPANKGSMITQATCKINSEPVKVKVKRWIPSCSETIFTNNVLTNAIKYSLKSGNQFEEILTLNEDNARITSQQINLSDMKDSSGKILVSVSTFESPDSEIMDEFMITGIVKGGNKPKTYRALEFQDSVYLVEIGLDKNTQDSLYVRVNYNINENAAGRQIRDIYSSKCNMVRLSIRFVPDGKQEEIDMCKNADSASSSIKTLIPSILPEQSSGNVADDTINFEYSTMNTGEVKYKLSPNAPDKNKVRFKLKKASTFRFEMIIYSCKNTPIERLALLKSVKKTHNKSVTDTVAIGQPNVGNSIVIYVEELLPGTYEVEILHAWINTIDEKVGNIEEIFDFQIEIYSLHQDKQASEAMHLKTRHIIQLEEVIRDLSVVSFANKDSGYYLGENALVPIHPKVAGDPLKIPFKIIPSKAQLMIYASKVFNYIESIGVYKKSSNDLIKKIDKDSDKSINEILDSGEYYIKFTHRSVDSTKKTPYPQDIYFGISDYDNLKKYQLLNSGLLNSCENGVVDNKIILLKGKSGITPIKLNYDSTELLNLQLHYSMFITTKPLLTMIDKRRVTESQMRNFIIPSGNHTLVVKGPASSLDSTCILASLIKYAKPATSSNINIMPSITMKTGTQSVFVTDFKESRSSIPLPLLKNNKQANIFLSTLLIHFDTLKGDISNSVDLDMNFDTLEIFDYSPYFYNFESSNDKMISYIDIVSKDGSEVQKQFEIVHKKSLEQGQYQALLSVLDGDHIADFFDQCNAVAKHPEVFTLKKDSKFYYDQVGKEDFVLAYTSDVIFEQGSKFYDEESKSVFIEIVYDIKQPSFLELTVEFDISEGNVELYVFQDFNDTKTLEDQEIGESTLEIPNPFKSLAIRHTSIYLTSPGKYSVYIIDDKVPRLFKSMKDFEDVHPCYYMKISHSIQKFTSNKLQPDSIRYLSVWPRRITIDEPFFVNAKKSLIVTIYPNTLKLNPKKPPKINFDVIDVKTKEKIYEISPDHTSVQFPQRKYETKDGIESMQREIKIVLFFKNLRTLIGNGMIATLSDKERVTDTSFIPNYIVWDAQDSQEDQINAKQSRTVVENLKKNKYKQPRQRSKQKKEKIGASIELLEDCYDNCKNGDCNDEGKCVCRPGFTGTF